jgi:hypothetical protein
MIHVSQTVAVNDGAEPRLDVAQIWHGLVMKAEDPTRFVRGITACRILERLPDGLVREVDLRGTAVRERIVYRKPECVSFVRLNGAELGLIRNEIVDDPMHGLSLRFTFDLEIAGLAPGSAEETAHAERMIENYRAAVKGTIAQIRELVRAGRLAA